MIKLPLRAWLLVMSFVTVAWGVTVSSEQGSSGAAATRKPTNAAEFDEMIREISNWGRWGKDDELGTANLVTDAKRRQAAALVKTGIAVGLGASLRLGKLVDQNSIPFERRMTKSLTSDTFTVGYHSTLITHIDALCHSLYKGQAYNGHAISAIANEQDGCTKLGIDVLRDGIVTRGVLIDIPRLKNVPYLEPGTPVYVEDIEAWETKAGVKVTAGDAILLRVGRWLRRAKEGPWEMAPPNGRSSGFHASVLPWFKARDVAFVGSDGFNDVVPSVVEGVGMPFHAAIPILGIISVELLDLDTVAATAAKLNRWEFMLTGGPLVTGGTGSPINMVAIF